MNSLKYHDWNCDVHFVNILCLLYELFEISRLKLWRTLCKHFEQLPLVNYLTFSSPGPTGGVVPPGGSGGPRGGKLPGGAERPSLLSRLRQPRPSHLQVITFSFLCYSYVNHDDIYYSYITMLFLRKLWWHMLFLRKLWWSMLFLRKLWWHVLFLRNYVIPT